MIESIMEEVNVMFAGKAFLRTEDVMKLLECSEQVVYNWIKRHDARKRPPRIVVGKEIRFPKREFVKWLAEEQST
jgi:predicted DNA-binding transcriptional regulator AlpA